MGIRLTLRERAEEHGLDEDCCGGYVGLATISRNMGEIPDDEWEEMSRDWALVRDDESSEPQEAAAAALAPPSRF